MLFILHHRRAAYRRRGERARDFVVDCLLAKARVSTLAPYSDRSSESRRASQGKPRPAQCSPPIEYLMPEATPSAKSSKFSYFIFSAKSTSAPTSWRISPISSWLRPQPSQWVPSSVHSPVQGLNITSRSHSSSRRIQLNGIQRPGAWPESIRLPKGLVPTRPGGAPVNLRR